MNLSRVGILFIVAIGAFFFFPFASANFACGELKNTSDVSSAWLAVSVFYSDQPSKTTSCRVSPSNNRFCCDPLEIKGVTWAVGKKLNASFVDMEKGYFTDPVQLTITGNGYDVFPLMQLKKGLSVVSPKNHVFYSNRSEVSFHLLSEAPFNRLSYSLKYGNNLTSKVLCENCTESVFSLPFIGSGVYEFTARANDGSREFIENFNFTVVDYLFIKRTFECRGCSQKYVPAGTQVNVSLFVNASHPLQGFLTDLVSLDWMLLENYETFDYGDTHRQIRFPVQGSSFTLNYSLFSPSVFFPRKYIFQAVLENISMPQDKITVYRLFKSSFLAFPAKNLPMKHSSRSFFWFYDISPEHPFYAAYKGKFPLQIVVFPKSFVPKTYIFLMVPGEKHLKGSYVDFSLYSNLRESDIKEMTLAYGVEKEYLSKKDQNSSRLWKYLPSKKWEAQPTSYLSEDSSYIYFNASVDGPGTFSIVMGDG